MDHHVLREKSDGAVVSSTYVSWRHRIGLDAVCLARLVKPLTGVAAAAIVLSELAENPDAAGISSDFPGAADAAWAAFGADLPDPTRVSWYAHHGPFSSYDPTGPETLTEVTLDFDGTHFSGDLAGHHLLTSEAAARLLLTGNLRPVDEVLTRVGRA
ncbi:hypothetical protein [Streptomyces violascens]|uniref:Uncharacterized protein n=1 Tax=Streptomyces violascens TaxID=67381 RepID=A0ABQ3QL70_9ACTN|nr:hypothetical protein [Streptomyces violascens]GGU44574.1 hypothetical protein GCM10010289_76450 [Streptomyces violascens]GHI38016.1 hypothetical protein Sviol_24240 [Streptomyces violascens]